ncbi:MAG: hypothetical protein R3D33_06765 [Hyphomicrobiaceae bacterium]
MQATPDVLRILYNLIVLAAELLAIAGAAALGYQMPYAFAALTGLLGVGLGIGLERARLRNELPFYFDRERPPGGWFVGLVASGEALVKGVIASAVALLLFSGTNRERLFWVAVAFAVTTFAGTSVLRRLTLSLRARPSRWGYFRLAVPLGLLFSTIIAILVAVRLVEQTGLVDILRHVTFDMAARPSLDQVSELLFQLKQLIDATVVTLLSTFLDPDVAQIAGIIASVNALAGFVVAVYAVVIAEAVRLAERV